MAIEKNIKEAMDLKHKRIMKSINHKDQSIAFWASMNNAVNYSCGTKSLEEVFKIADKIYKHWQEFYLETNELDEDTEEKAF